MIGETKPPRTAIRILREFFQIMDASGRSAQEIAEASGAHKVTLSYWRHGQRSPSLIQFEATCNAMGYRLELVPIDNSETCR